MTRARSLRDYQHEAAAARERLTWPAECLEAERKFDHRAARRGSSASEAPLGVLERADGCWKPAGGVVAGDEEGA